MFKNCSSLTFLNLSSFEISGNDNISNMFTYCTSLGYLNIKNFKILEHPRHLVIQNIIRNTTRNIVICINTQGQPEVYEHLEKKDKSCVSINCEENWMKKRKKIVEGICYEEYINEEILNNTDNFENNYNDSEIKEIFRESSNLIIKNVSNDTIINNNICDVIEFFLG